MQRYNTFALSSKLVHRHPCEAKVHAFQATGPSPNIAYTLASKNPHSRHYFKAKVYASWAHGPLGY